MLKEFIHKYLDKKKRVYLDHAAATPLSARARKAMEPYWSMYFANPSAIHTEGRTARSAVETVRQTIASWLQIQPSNLIFTSGGTESNNIAILGYCETLFRSGTPYENMRIISTKLEHPATQKSLEEAARLGVKIDYVAVGECGRIDEQAFRDLLDESVVLVTCTHINSEIGVLQDTRSLSRIIKKQFPAGGTRPLLHVDAAQSPLWYRCEPNRLGADLLSLDFGKCGGPKGVGALVSRGVMPIKVGRLFGGGQENGVRPGTEPVPLIVGGVEAFVEAQEGCQVRSQKVRAVQADAFAYLQATLATDAIINGPTDTNRVPNNIHISLPGYDSEYASIVLDTHGFAVSTKSACSSSDSGESAVVRQLSGDSKRAQSTMRFTIREDVTKNDMRRAIDIVAKHIKDMKPYKS